MNFTLFFTERIRWILFLILIRFLLLNGSAMAQSESSSDYTHNPSWVKMMSDPKVNYFEAVKAYEDFWKGKVKPTDEAEEMESRSEQDRSAKLTEKEKKELVREQLKEKKLKERENKKVLTTDDMKQLEWKREMTYQCKRFEEWKRSVLPYLQNDGSILSEEERMQIQKQRQEELKNAQDKK